jgi:hypothetical protein
MRYTYFNSLPGWAHVQGRSLYKNNISCMVRVSDAKKAEELFSGLENNILKG